MPMNENKPDRAAKFRKLQEAYLAKLPGQFDQMSLQWRLSKKDKDDGRAFSELQKVVHNLAGSAGTFGYPAVSDKARILEVLVSSFVNLGQSAKRDRDTIDELIVDIGEQIQQSPQEAPCAITVSPIGSGSSSRSHGKLVYVVEDTALLAQEIRAQLERYGYEVEVYGGTTQAVSALDQKIPAAMLIDLNLPEGELAGSSFINSYKLGMLKETPLIFMSSRDDWEARLSVARAGSAAYLSKPIDFDELLDRLDLLIGGQDDDPYRVLLVDDEEVLAEHYALILAEAGMETKIVSSLTELLPTISSFHPDLILMDIFMPECSGLEAAKVIRQKNELLSIPIVFLSTDANLKNQREVLELGGDAFLKKPITEEYLLSSVATRVSRFRKLRSQMQQDALTGLYNHATLKIRLESELGRALRQNAPLAFAMLDIDNFKKVNDQYGHPAGDAVIKSISRLLKQRLRKSDIVGRYGGEEFAVIFPETTEQEAKRILDNLRQQFSEIIHGHGVTIFHCTFSGGVAAAPSIKEISALIDTADKALYKAKNGGKNRICIYGEDP